MPHETAAVESTKQQNTTTTAVAADVGTDIDHAHSHDNHGDSDHHHESAISMKPIMSLYFWSIVTMCLMLRFAFMRSTFSNGIPVIATVTDAIDYIGLSLKWLFLKIKMMMPIIKILLGKFGFVLTTLLDFA